MDINFKYNYKNKTNYLSFFNSQLSRFKYKLNLQKHKKHVAKFNKNYRTKYSPYAIRNIRKKYQFVSKSKYFRMLDLSDINILSKKKIIPESIISKKALRYRLLKEDSGTLSRVFLAFFFLLTWLI